MQSCGRPHPWNLFYADRALKLRRDETWLLLHESGIVMPSFEGGPLVRLVESKHAHENDRAGIDCQLPFDREMGRVGTKSTRGAPGNP
jgi:hypothetical protein